MLPKLSHQAGSTPGRQPQKGRLIPSARAGLMGSSILRGGLNHDRWWMRAIMGGEIAPSYARLSGLLGEWSLAAGFSPDGDETGDGDGSQWENTGGTETTA